MFVLGVLGVKKIRRRGWGRVGVKELRVRLP
jgi:hypothetical protein